MDSACAALLAGCGKDDASLRTVTEATFPPYEFLRGREVVSGKADLAAADRLRE